MAETILVEFTSDVSTAWKVGTIEALKAPLARSLIDAGQAKESDQLAFMSAALDSKAEKRFADFEKKIETLFTGSKPKGSGGPPGGKELGTALEVGEKVTHSSSPVDRTVDE